MKGFRTFILRGNLVDLAVAVVIGTQFSNLVKQFVTSFFNPLLALFGGSPNFNNLSFTIHKADFTYGAFLTEVISFVISAAVIYFMVVLPVASLLRMFDKNQAATTKNCPVCDSKIPLKALRCPECTSMLAEDASVPEPAGATSGS